MKKLLTLFLILSTLILFGCEEPSSNVDPPPSTIPEYSQPPLWLQGRWGSSLTEPEYVIEITTDNIIVNQSDTELFNFSSLDVLYTMKIQETSLIFKVTATSPDQPTIEFTFTKHSSTSLEIFIDQQNPLNDIGPVFFSPYVDPGELKIEIEIDDTPPTTLTLSCTQSGSLSPEVEAEIMADLQAELYQWYLDGVLLDNASTHSLVVNTQGNPLSSGDHTIICKATKDGDVYFDEYSLAITK